ncbi:MAG: hypothetical protein GY702_24980 [Desulfobulbaceae bacterium]|nr:hypothetical protein [Desulfobulbaceae bacterium]
MTMPKPQIISPYSTIFSKILRHRNYLALCLIVATFFIVIYSYQSIKDTIDFTVNSSTEAASDFADVMREKALQATMERISTNATAKAYQVGTELEKAVAAATTLAEVLSGMVVAEVVVDVGRDAVNSMLRRLLSRMLMRYTKR